MEEDGDLCQGLSMQPPNPEVRRHCFVTIPGAGTDRLNRAGDRMTMLSAETEAPSESQHGY
jgi:hypothetical protein